MLSGGDLELGKTHHRLVYSADNFTAFVYLMEKNADNSSSPDPLVNHTLPTVCLSLLTCILIVLLLSLALPRRFHNRLWHCCSGRDSDTQFNYIDVGLYKTRHSMYRKEVFSNVWGLKRANPTLGVSLNGKSMSTQMVNTKGALENTSHSSLPQYTPLDYNHSCKNIPLHCNEEPMQYIRTSISFQSPPSQATLTTGPVPILVEHYSSENLHFKSSQLAVPDVDEYNQLSVSQRQNNIGGTSRRESSTSIAAIPRVTIVSADEPMKESVLIDNMDMPTSDHIQEPQLNTNIAANGRHVLSLSDTHLNRRLSHNTVPTMTPFDCSYYQTEQPLPFQPTNWHEPYSHCCCRGCLTVGQTPDTMRDFNCQHNAVHDVSFKEYSSCCQQGSSDESSLSLDS